MAARPPAPPAEPYWGEIPRADMEWLLAEVERGRPWRDAVTSGERASLAAKAAFILDVKRSSWIMDLPVRPEPEVLDIGAGLGGVAAGLAPYARRVVALEPVGLRARFIAQRARQDGLENVLVARGSALSLPLRPASFDVAVLSGVLEWVGKGSRDPGGTQLRVLQAIRRALRPDGVLVIGIENRTGIWFFFGREDHSYLPFTSLLPRPLASLVTRIARGHPYDTYTYTHSGYRRLLADAGFSDVATVLPIWSYNFPEFLMPLAPGPRAELQAELMGAGGRAARRPRLRKVHVEARLSQGFANDFIFFARTGPARDPGWLRRALASRWASYGLPGRAEDLLFLIRNRSHPTLIAFPAPGAPPCAVLRFSGGPSAQNGTGEAAAFSPARHEIAVLRELRDRLPAELAGALPRPIDLLEVHAHEIGVTSFLPGAAPMLPGGLPGDPSAAHELGAVTERMIDWLGRFHPALDPVAGGEWPMLESRELAQGVAAGLARVPGGPALAAALVERIPSRPLGRVARRPQHGDFWLSNLRLRPGGELGVIDWERFGRVPMAGFDALHFTNYAIVCLLIDPRKPALNSERVVREILDPGPLGRAVRPPLERYLAAQGFLPDALPILYPIYLAAFIAEYGANRERPGIVATMRDLLSPALARPELAAGGR